MNGMIARRFLSAAVFALVLLAGAGCGSPQAQQTDWGDKLVVYNWSDYMDPEVLEQFEAQYGVSITYITYESSEEMLTKISSQIGKADLVVPTDYLVTFLRDNDYLSPLRHENVPNFSNLNPELLNKEYDPGNEYCVPYFWGTAGIAYDISRTGHEIHSWSEFFASDMHGRIAMLDDSRPTLTAALMYMGFNPNSTRIEELYYARDFLLALGQNVIYSASPEELLVSGQVDAVFTYNGDVMQAASENPNIRFVIPNTGGILWVDSLCILKNAPHARLAEEFINFVLDAQVGAQLANFSRYASPNLAAMPFIAGDDLSNPVIYPPSSAYDTLHINTALDNKAASLYNSVWLTIKRDQ